MKPIKHQIDDFLDKYGYEFVHYEHALLMLDKILTVVAYDAIFEDLARECSQAIDDLTAEAKEKFTPDGDRIKND